MKRATSFEFVFLLYSFLQYSEANLNNEKEKACERNVQIKALSKGIQANILHILESRHAWSYDIKGQRLLEYFNIEKHLRNTSRNGIQSATEQNKCHRSFIEKPLLLTKEVVFSYTDIRNDSTWTQKSFQSAMDRLKIKYNMRDMRELDMGNILAIASVCNETLNVVHIYLQSHNLYICNSLNGCKREYLGIYEPFGKALIIPMSKPPEAISFLTTSKYSFDVAFVQNEQLYVWNSKERNLSVSKVKEIFGCTSQYASIVILVGAGAMVILMSIIIAVVLFFQFVKKRRFADGGTTEIFEGPIFDED